MDELLAAKQSYSSQEALEIVGRLAAQVSALHVAGITHRAISPIAVTLDDALQPTLSPPELVAILGGTGAGETDAWSPRELRRPQAWHVPRDIAAARQLFQAEGIALDPRQIDIAQLGDLLCRLLTGESADTYFHSPRTKGKVPPHLQPLVERSCGFATSDRLETADQFIAAIRATAPDIPVVLNVDGVPVVAGNPDPASVADTPASKAAVESDTASFIVAKPASDTSVGRDEPAPSARSADDELPFHTLGHYRIVARIGHGGMGDVYKGYEEMLDRTVAIKVLPRDFAREPDFVRRFRAEATAAARLIHPNIIQIYFIGEEAGHHFFAMQYVEGESLADLLARRGQLSADDTLAIVQQVLAGLAAAHRQGLVHRDIKPGNILLDRNHDRALLADFGLVKSGAGGSGKTASGVIMGTVDYIAPEQARGHAVDSRADLYAVGVVMYQMLSGGLPFEGDSPTAIIFQHVYEKPRPLTEAVPDISPALSAIVAKLLEKSPADRYQTAEQVLNDLRAFHEGRPLPSFMEDAPPVATHSAASAAALRPRQTIIIPAPVFDEIPALPAESTIAASPGWWQRTQDRALDFFRAQSPELLQHLQNTGQQVDSAVAEYERRRLQLEGLIREAEAIVTELETQLAEHRRSPSGDERGERSSAPASAGGLSVDGSMQNPAVAELEQKLAEQQEQLGSMRLRLAQNNATLHQLRSQRDLLRARLKAAEARVHLAGGRSKSGRRRISFIAASCAGMLLIGLVGLYVWRQPDGTASAARLAASRKSFRPIAPAEGPGGEFVYRLGTTIRAVAFQPRHSRYLGTRIAAGGEDGSVFAPYLFENGNMMSAELIAQHPPRVNALAFSPDGELVATAGDDKTIKLWSAVRNDAPLRQFDGHTGPVRAVAFSADGMKLLSGGDDATVRLWDRTTGRELQSVNVARGVTSLAWSQDGERFHVGHARQTGAPALRSWHLTRRGIAGTVACEGLQTVGLFLPQVGSLGYSLHGPGTPVLVWNETTCERIGTVGSDVAAAAFSASGTRALTADSNGALTLWDTETAKSLEQFPADPSPVTSLALSLDGEFGAVAHADGTLKFRKYALPAQAHDIIFVGSPVNSVAFSPDGGKVLSGGLNELDVWELDSGRDAASQKIKAQVSCLKYVADGSRMIYAAGTPDGASQWVGLRTPANLGRETLDLSSGEFQEPSGHTGRITSVDCFKEGNRAVTSSVDGTLRIWDVAQKKEVQTLKLGGPVCSVAISPQDDAYLLVGVEEQGVQLWNRNQKQKVRDFLGIKGPARCAAFSADGSRVVAAGRDQKIRIWDTATATLLATLSGHEGSVNSVVFVDGGRFALSAADDGTVRFWNIDRKSLLTTFRGHWGIVRSVAVSPRGDTAVSGSDDGTIRVWKLPGSN